MVAWLLNILLRLWLLLGLLNCLIAIHKVIELLDPDPPVKVKLNTLQQYSLRQFRQPLWHKPPSHPHHIVGIRHLLAVVQRPPCQHFVIDHPERPHVRLLTVVVLDVGLGRHVGGRPHIIEHLGFGASGDLAVSEVADLGSAVFDEDVRGLEVAVDYSPLMEAFTPGNDTFENCQCLGFG